MGTGRNGDMLLFQRPLGALRFGRPPAFTLFPSFSASSAFSLAGLRPLPWPAALKALPFAVCRSPILPLLSRRSLR